jgi:hypothetical protein
MPYRDYRFECTDADGTRIDGFPMYSSIGTVVEQSR